MAARSGSARSTQDKGLNYVSSFDSVPVCRCSPCACSTLFHSSCGHPLFVLPICNTPYRIATPIRPPNACAGLRPIAKLTTRTIQAEKVNPQNPHFFHLKRAIAQTRLSTPKAIRTGNAQSGISGRFCRIASLPTIYMNALAEFAIIMNTKYAVRQPCRCFGCEG